MGVFFDGRGLPTPSNEYVVWVDVMGTQARMSRSLQQTANFIFKLHIAALTANSANAVKLYPVMDGVYAACPEQRNMLAFLRRLFSLIATEFNERINFHRFMVRGCLAFGPTIHGATVPDTASNELSANPLYKNSILLGLPMVQAHSFETSAPPFGIFVHESARSFSSAGDAPLHELWWKWAPSTDRTWQSLQENLARYLTWCKERSMRIDYKSDRIDIHKLMAEQYFAEDDSPPRDSSAEVSEQS